MTITNEKDLKGIEQASIAAAITLKKMREYIKIGMNAKELDDYGATVMKEFGAKSAPKVAYSFPGFTCICVNNEVAHGIPVAKKIFQNGDLVNIDVSVELNGYWADNGGSFVLGNDIKNHLHLVNTSRNILYRAVNQIKGGVRIAEIGRYIEIEAKKEGYKVIKNLVGHGVGRSLHEEPTEIPCFYDRFNLDRFKKNSVIAVETFISTKSTHAHETADGWTLSTRDGSFVAQHEHTLIVTDGKPLILTAQNDIWE